MNASLPDVGEVTTEVIDGLVIRLARSGPKAGRPVLITSPWPESLYAFHAVLPHLAAAHPVIALDLPGFGHSQSRPEVMTPKALGGFLIKAVEHLGLKDVHAVGPDVGALAVLFAAAERPQLFTSLAVGGGAVRVDLAAGVLADLIASPPGSFATVDGVVALADYFQAAEATTPSAVVDDFRAGSAGARFEAAVAYVRAYKQDLPLLGPLLPQIRPPVLVLAGEHDEIVPAANARFLAERLPHNRLALIDAGHRAWAEAPQGYGAALSGWIGGGYRLA